MKVNPWMLAFESRMRSDSNYMGASTDALMDLIPAYNYDTPQEWLRVVVAQLGLSAVTGGMHHVRSASSSATWDMSSPERAETRKYYEEKAATMERNNG